MPVSSLGKPPPSNAGDTRAYDSWATSPDRGAPDFETLEDIQLKNHADPYRIPNGHYYLDTEQWTPGGIHVWFRKFTTGRWKDVWFVTAYEQDGTPELMGGHSDREFVFAKILSSGPHDCMARYGRLFSRCGVCNEELTEEEREGIAGHVECFESAFLQTGMKIT